MHKRPVRVAPLPRDRRSAAFTAAAFMAVGAVMLVMMSGVPGFLGHSAFSAAVTYGVAAVLAALSVVCWRIPHRLPESFWAVVPILAICAVTGTNVVTDDVSVGAQLFLLWPCLYSAMFLPRKIVAVVALLVLPAEAVIMLPRVSTAEAVSNSVQLTIAVTMASAIILYLRQRADALLALTEKDALEDHLTGLPNRRAFDRQVAAAARRVEETGGPLSLLTMDVDRFKHINDTWGHPAGDAALQAVATALKAAVRQSDSVARLGGDEFVALIHSDGSGASRAVAALQSALAEIHHLPGGPPQLSVGVATLPGDADDMPGLLAASDAALYDVKARRRAAADVRPKPPPYAPRRSWRTAGGAVDQLSPEIAGVGNARPAECPVRASATVTPIRTDQKLMIDRSST